MEKGGQRVQDRWTGDKRWGDGFIGSLKDEGNMGEKDRWRKRGQSPTETGSRKGWRKRWKSEGNRQ